MKKLYFDMSSGISGDMALAGLFGLGADSAAFSDKISSVIGKEIRISLKETVRNGVKCAMLNIDAEVSGEPFRNIQDISKMIVSSGFTEKVKGEALETFRIIAVAESQVHGVKTDEVHFHEIGAVDTIIDVVGTAWCLEALEIESVSACEPVFGYGSIKCAHGVMPLPAPATMKILKDVPVRRLNVEGELTTPTGAALLKKYAESFTNAFRGTPVKEFYSAGTKEFDGVPNFLRSIIFENSSVSECKDEVLVMKTNIDDMSGENFGFLLNALMTEGALDVTYSPAYGKKNRPLYTLTALLPKDKEKEITKTIFRYSTTGGLRVQRVERLVMNRDMVTVDIDGEPVRVKRLYYDDIEKFSPEWDDCVRVSKKIITTPIDVHCRATLAASDGNKPVF